jgi:simple sugar transport system ATP-binding protein
VLILDEPTAVLTPGEAGHLFEVLRALAASGKTIIFISHKLKEVREIADQVTVMRDGAVVGTVAGADERTLARMMVGREVFLDVAKPPAQRGRPMLQVRGLSAHRLDDVSFDAYEGEILGVAGVEGNGQTELAEVLAGLRAASAGSAFVDGKVVAGTGHTPDARAARGAGLAHIPEDRLTNGAALGLSVRDNLIVDRYHRAPYQRGGVLQPGAIAENAQRLIESYGVVTQRAETPMGALSGGNMQKVIVARELSAGPRVLIAAQPTRGVDIGATEFIQSQLIAGRGQGMAILLISADLGEVMRLSDRLMVMHNGRIAAIFNQVVGLSEEEIGLYMSGAKTQ